MTNATPLRGLFAILTAVATAGLMLLTSAHRAEAVDPAKPSGPGCQGNAFVDKKGDQTDDYSGQSGGTGPGPENLDVLAGWFSTDESGTTTANIKIANLTKDVPPEASGGIYWYMWWDAGGRTNFVKAWIDKAGGEHYGYGFSDSESVPGFIVYNTEGTDNKGKLWEGTDGVVQIDLPPALSAAGTTLVNSHADADYLQGQDDFYGLNAHADQAPDSGGGGKKYTIGASCSGTPDGSPTPTPTGGPTELPVTLPASLGSAKRAKRGAVLRLKVSSSKPVTDLAVIIRARTGKGKALGRGKLASLDGTAKIKIKLAKKLKRGRYLLIAQGRVDGELQSTGRTVKLKR